MSFISAVFDPLNPPVGSTTTFVAGYPTGVFQMLVHNETNQNLILTWGSNSVYAKAWEVGYFCVQSNAKVIGWSIQSAVTGVNAPISQITIEVYGPSEQIVGTYPVAINRVTTNANSLGTQANLKKASWADVNNTATTLIPKQAGLTGYLKQITIIVPAVAAKVLSEASIQNLAMDGGDGSNLFYFNLQAAVQAAFVYQEHFEQPLQGSGPDTDIILSVGVLVAFISCSITYFYQ